MPGIPSASPRSRVAARLAWPVAATLAGAAALLAPHDAVAADEGGLHVIVETRLDLRDPRLPARPVAALRWSAGSFALAREPLSGLSTAPPWQERARRALSSAADDPRLLALPDDARGAGDYGVEFGSFNLSQTDNTRLTLRVRRGQPMLYWRLRF